MDDAREPEVTQPPLYRGHQKDAVIPNDFGPDTRDDYQVLKDGDLFAVFDPGGDMNGRNDIGEMLSKDGLFHCDTRYLSRFALTINGVRPTEMGHEACFHSGTFRGDLGNTRLIDDLGQEVRPYKLHLARERFLSDGMYETLTVTNYNLDEVSLDLVYDCWADFRDVFEVRGVMADERGRLRPPEAGDNRLVMSYDTRDGRRLSTEVLFNAPVLFQGIRPHVSLTIPPGESRCIEIIVRISDEAVGAARAASRDRSHGTSDLRQPPRSFAEAQADLRKRLSRKIARTAKITTDNPEFNAWLTRSSVDLAMLSGTLPTGPYPYAGVPWFSVPFGRDGIISALQVLWLNADLADGVLGFLASVQSTESSQFRDAEPGKILHESRNGEMARMGEVPFERYYGGIDQTLLFIILAHAHYQRTGRVERLRELRPNIEAALDWAKTYGDRDGDGFVEYFRAQDTGLRNQGWKDSNDALFHEDGRLADGPIALIEVQAYYVAALRAASGIFEALDDTDRAARLRDQAEDLVEAIDRAFWDEELQTWCIALDGTKSKVRVASSNAGHVLYSGAAKPARVQAFVDRLNDPDMLTGWGVRTIAQGASRYNPMGYHNGSIWPHDNALICRGLARYGQPETARRILDALFDASCHFEEHRLPELYCGFEKTDNGAPIAYPSACSPQAWAAGAPFLCLEACLGLTLNAGAGEVLIDTPTLPRGVDEVTITDLPLGDTGVDLRFLRKTDAVEVQVLKADRVRVVLDGRPLG